MVKKKIKILRKLLNFRLLSKISLRVIIGIITFPILILIYLINPIILIRFKNAPSSRIGHLVTEIEYYLCKKKLEKNKTKFPIIVDLFYFDSIVNTQLVKMCKRHLISLPSLILFPLHKTHKFLSAYFKFLSKHSIFLGYHRDVFHYHKILPTQLSFTKQELLMGAKEIEKKFGVKKKSKFACVTIRDSDYLKKEFPSKNFSYHDYRNTDLKKFIPAIKLMAKNEYIVFRMGKHTSKKLSIKNPRIIDYANSKFRSDFLDVYLAAKCDFHFASSTGLQNITEIFKKPQGVLVMPVGSGMISYKEKTICLTKNHFDTKRNKKLTLKEIFNYNVASALSSKEFKKNKIFLQQNSAKEIKNLAFDLINCINKNWQISKKEKILQNKFKKIFLQQHMKLVNNNSKSDYYNEGKNIINSDSFWRHSFNYPTHGKILCNYSYTYLRNNKWWLN